jgi:hypothetical protein
MPFRILSTAAVFLLSLTAWGFADDEVGSDDAHEPSSETTSSFLRLTRDDQQSPIALETAIVRYRSCDASEPWTVDLVAALHIAEKSYYEQLNHEFASYDAILYELVASEDSQTPQPGAPTGNHPLTLVQNGMKDMLGLEYQLKAIDYTCKNMVHADMSPDEFVRSMEQKGETPVSMFSRMVGYGIARQNQSSDAMSSGQLLFALFDKNRALALKRIMAEQINDGDGSLTALEGPNGSTLISGRNKVALKVLQEQVAQGKRRLAVFYGAGHMPDMQKQLNELCQVELVETRWLPAWDLKTSPKNTKSKEQAKKQRTSQED